MTPYNSWWYQSGDRALKSSGLSPMEMFFNNSDLMGSAMNCPVQLLVVSQQGTELKKQGLSPSTMNHTNDSYWLKTPKSRPFKLLN